MLTSTPLVDVVVDGDGDEPNMVRIRRDPSKFHEIVAVAVAVNDHVNERSRRPGPARFDGLY